MSHNNLSIRQCAISLSFSSIIPFKLLHVSYILNLKALFWSDIWSHFSGLDSLKSLFVFLIDRPSMKQISPCLHRYVRPGNGFVPNFPLFEKVDVNGDNEQALFTFLKVGHCLIKHILKSIWNCNTLCKKSLLGPKVQGTKTQLKQNYWYANTNRPI